MMLVLHIPPGRAVASYGGGLPVIIA